MTDHLPPLLVDPQLYDVAEQGDAMDDPEYRALLGLDDDLALPTE